MLKITALLRSYFPIRLITAANAMTIFPGQDTASISERLARLLGYIESDPGNAALLGDAAACAFDEQRLDLCEELLARQQALGAVPPASMHLRGLCAMAGGRFEEALRAFAALPDFQSDPVILYNSAYAHALLGHSNEAIALLGDDIFAVVPQAITLKLHLLHHLGLLDEVIEFGARHADHPQVGAEVCGCVATALFDAEDIAGAGEFAARAMNVSDGLTVSGLLALNDGHSDDAIALFARALEMRPTNSRAHLGNGLALLEQHQFAQAAQQIDVAAQSFGNHAGSWVAAGWAHLLNGDLAQARARLEQGGRIDRGFAEVPGSLAVVALKEGKLDEARTQAKIALRLDPACLSATLAQSLLEAQAGHQDVANVILDAALHRPVDAQGKTIAQALARIHSLRFKNRPN
ncbi:tetratricopeptide repeat protein [Paraburkholderia sp. UYCP14C]|uniref:tetratricopeptide repeat protein n=1 Tax=Paraburkholderia sp. UYCP14C TaxID=2511130 RepID=UPI001022964E|nr:tetratricopeptide repeat protein [Paraburkholderia sp. UYCP14C]RZF29097.1 tetratricopeptide repeat protein [Paraburkholderia sp. UYCP14C]